MRRLLLLVLCAILASGPATSQVVTDIRTDGSLPGQDGIGGAIDGPGGVYEIGEDDGHRAGSNLFHSFEVFDVGTGDTALFTANPVFTTDNIIGRVTGGMTSQIDGTVKSEVSGANLYLLNPQGIVFGPNASLDVKGSFHASTTDALVFSNGERFETRPGGSVPLLAALDPVAYGFLGDANARITVQAPLLEAPEELSLRAGAVELEAAELQANRIVVEGGEVLLDAGSLLRGVGVGKRIDVLGGEVTLLGEVSTQSPLGGRENGGDITIAGESIEIRRGGPIVHDLRQVNAGSFGGRGGNIRVTGGTVRIVDGASVHSNGFRGGTSGDIALVADSLTLDDSVVSVTDSHLPGGESGDIRIDVADVFELAGPFGDNGLFANGGNIEITAPVVRMSDGARVQASTFGAADAGTITFRVDTLRVENRALINSSGGLLATGDAGTVSIEATEAVDIVGEGEFTVNLVDLILTGEGASSGIIAITGGAGNAGRVSIDAPRITVAKGGVVSAFGGGGLLTPQGGDAGSVSLTGQHIEVVDGGIVDSGTTFSGDAGTVTLVAEQSVVVRGTSPGGVPSRIRSFNAGRDSGGDIRISAPSVEVSDGAAISAATVDIALGADRGSSAGEVRIEADVLTVASGGRIESSSFSAAGDGGLIDVEATKLVTLTGEGSGIFSQATSGGAGGEIRISAPVIQMKGGAAVSTEATPGLGAAPVLFKDLTDAGIGLLDSPSTGDAGSIEMTATRVSLEGDSSIATRSTGTGDAGQIELNVRDLELVKSRITAEALGSFGGSISVNGKEIVELDTGQLVARLGPGQSAGKLVRLEDSEIATSVGLGIGNGGNVLVNANSVVIEGEGMGGGTGIEAKAAGGDGGNILLATELAFASGGEVGAFLDASSQSGTAGVVEIASSPTNITAAVTPLNVPFQDAARLMRPSCAARAGGGGGEGSFHVARRRGLPASPEELMLAFYSPELDGAYRDETLPAVAAPPPFDPGPDPVDAAQRLSEAARSALSASDPARARTLLAEAAAAVTPLGDTPARAYLQIHQATIRAALAAADPSQRGVDLLAAHGALLDAARLAQQIDAPRAESYALGNLGALYRSEHRAEEALYATRRALRAAERAEAPDAIYRWHWQEAQILREQGRALEAVAAYRRAVTVVEETRQDALVRYGASEVTFTRLVGPVYLELVSALLETSGQLSDPAQREAAYIEARSIMEKEKAAELRDYFKDECVAEPTPIRDMPRTAFVYPIPLPDRLELLVNLPDGIRRFTLPVEGAVLDDTARRFRLFLHDRISQAHALPGGQLYDWLVRPYADQLAGQDVDTIVFVPGGSLRTIPLAALHDGEGFLIERYAVAVTPGLSLVDPKPLDTEDAKFLLAGVSEATRFEVGGRSLAFGALPQVPGELAAVHELYGGEVLLDEAFGAERFETRVQQGSPAIVHVASHALFTGDPDTSFLLTHDGPLTMEQLADVVAPTQHGQQPLELLVLSACETAAGDERAALGLAGVAIRAGARSAVGSLWPIEDEAAQELIVGFYEELEDDDLSKAEALRRAQTALLDGEFRHPYFWSPFLLISNWL